MRGKHHYTVILIYSYDEEDEFFVNHQEVKFQTNKRWDAERYIERHRYMEVTDSDWCYIRFWLRKDY